MITIEGVRWMHQARDRKMGVEIGREVEGFGVGGDWIWRLEDSQQLAVFKYEVC